MGRYRSVWSCDLQLCKTDSATVIGCETEGKVRIQQRDTEPRISWGVGGCAFFHTKITFSTFGASGSDRAELEVKGDGKCDQVAVEKEVRDRTGELCETEREGSDNAMGFGAFTCTQLAPNIFSAPNSGTPSACFL